MVTDNGSGCKLCHCCGARSVLDIDHAVKALPFRDRLLCNHKELIKRILSYRSLSHLEILHNERIYVTPNGVGDY